MPRACTVFRLQTPPRSLGGRRSLPDLGWGASEYPPSPSCVPLYKNRTRPAGCRLLQVTRPPGPTTPVLPVSDTPRDSSKPKGEGIHNFLELLGRASDKDGGQKALPQPRTQCIGSQTPG